MTVKIKIGAIMRKRYFTANHRPSTRSGKDVHQIIISGSVMLWRKEVICQGKGAKSKYSIPNGIVEIAPEVLDTSTSRPKPDSAERARSFRLRCSCCMFP